MKRLNIFSSNEFDTAKPYHQANGHCIDSMFDLHASAGTNVFGYNDPELVNSIQDNLSNATSSFWKLKHSSWEQFEELLDQITDNRYSSFLPALSGSDAVDNVIKILWDFYKGKRQTILVRKNSYHSGTITGWQMVHGLPFSNNWNKIQFVEFFDDLEEVVEKIGSNNIAGVIVDTIPWGTGLKSDSLDYWNNFQKTIDKHNLILCVDEVLTGIGRMGHWIHSHSLGLRPNIIVLGKALTAGHENLACSIFDDRITTEIKSMWLAIGNTRSVNTLGAVVACAVIEKMNKEHTLDYINSTVIPYIKNLESIFITNGYKSTSQGTMIQASVKNIQELETQLSQRGIYHQWDKFWHLSFFNITNEEMQAVTTAIKEII